MNNTCFQMNNGVKLLYDADWKSSDRLISEAKSMQQMKELDNDAIMNKGIPSLWLMENAARAVVDTVIEMVDDGSRICIICGAGNNGGDGVACAYMLMEKGYKVEAYLCGRDDKMTIDELAMEDRLAECGGTLKRLFTTDSNCDYFPDEKMVKDLAGNLSSSDCVIDALFGVGISRTIKNPYAQIIAMINGDSIDGAAIDNMSSDDMSSDSAYCDDTCKVKVVSCDIPSGINGDTGEVMGVAVKADVTVTFSCIKKGLLEKGVSDYVGALKVVPIGLPE